jgi:hypothetical protein
MEIGLKMKIADDHFAHAKQDLIMKALARSKHIGWCICGAKPGVCSVDQRTPGHGKITKDGPHAPWMDLE